MTTIDSIPEDVLVDYGRLLLLYELQSAQLVSKYWYRWVHKHLTVFKRYHFILTRESIINSIDVDRFKYSTITVTKMPLSDINKFHFLSSVPNLTLSYIDEDCDYWTSDDMFLTQSLTLSCCQKIKSIDIHFSNLITIKISNCPKLTSYPGYGTLHNLDIINYKMSTEVPNIKDYPKLRELSLFGIQRPINIDVFSDLKFLTYLDFTHCPHLVSLSSLTILKNLESLFITHSNISDLSPLSKLDKLGTLDLSHCKNIRDVSPVRHVKCLTLIKTNIVDVSSLMYVEQLDLDYCRYIHDFRSLRHVTRLSVIKTNFCDRDIQYLNDTNCDLLVLDARWTRLRCVDISKIDIKMINLEYCKLSKFIPSIEPCLTYLPKNFNPLTD